MLKRLVISAIMSWLAFLLMHGYYFFLGKWGTMHPSFVPLLLFVFVQVSAILFAIGLSVFQTIRGPKRIEPMAWGALAILPVFIWYSQISLAWQMQRELRERAPRLSWYLLSTESIANAIIGGVARCQLPHRLEGKRAVMFYDDRIKCPEIDLAALDMFIEQEEEFLGRTMPKKLHWVRSSILGLPGNAISGIAIANPESRQQEPYMELFPYKELTYIDYHEASHNTISTPSIYSAWRGKTPPMLLIEGWPQVRSLTWENLAWHCHREKLAGTTLTLEEFASPKYYYCADYRAYQQGGALVSVLLKHFGPEKFRELYFTCSQQSFRDDIKRVYNMTLEELDAFYWKEIEERYSFERATEQCSPEEKALLAEFRMAYDYQMRIYKKLFSDGSIESTKHFSYDTKGENERESMTETVTRHHAKDGKFFRTDVLEKSKSDDPFERSIITLQTPELSYYAYDFSGTKKYPPQTHSTCRILNDDNEKWRIAKSDIRDQFPYSILFGTGLTLDDYLWSPKNGHTVESVTQQDEQHVVITIRSAGNTELQLHLDPKRHWTLFKATETDSNEEKNWKSHATAEREYEGEIDGVPLMKKRISVRETTGEKSTSHVTQTVEITKLDRTPVPDSMFDPVLIPELKNIETPTTNVPSPTQRMRRHFVIIAIWLLVPIGIIAYRHNHQTTLKNE